MNHWRGYGLTFAVVLVNLTASAQERGVITPHVLLRESVRGMPVGETQEVRVVTANFAAREGTLFHTHRFPVTVYVLEGAFTLEMDGRQPVTVRTGQALMMPPQVRMTGYNRSDSVPLRLVIFYVSDPDTPFLDAIH